MRKQALDKATFERIEAYLLDALPQEEREAFESRMSAEPHLREEVELQRQNMLAVELGAFTRDLQRLAKGHALNTPVIDLQRRAGQRTVRLTLALAASVALVLGIGWWSIRPDATQRLFAEYHVVDPGLPVTMGATDDPVFQDAMVDFKLGEYQQAIEKWTPLLLLEPENDTLRYYIASAQLETDDLENASSAFRTVAQGGSPLRYKAEWYLLLSYVKAGNVSSALALEPSDASPFAARIKALQTRLME